MYYVERKRNIHVMYVFSGKKLFAHVTTWAFQLGWFLPYWCYWQLTTCIYFLFQFQRTSLSPWRDILNMVTGWLLWPIGNWTSTMRRYYVIRYVWAGGQLHKIIIILHNTFINLLGPTSIKGRGWMSAHVPGVNRFGKSTETGNYTSYWSSQKGWH